MEIATAALRFSIEGCHIAIAASLISGGQDTLEKRHNKTKTARAEKRGAGQVFMGIRFSLGVENHGLTRDGTTQPG